MTIAESQITIDAPIERVFRVMLDFEGYARWNPFVIGVRGAAEVGSPILLTVRWKSGKTIASPERVVGIERPADGRAKLVYRFEGLPAKLGAVRGDRVQTLESLPDGSTRYTSREAFSGYLRWFVPLADVQDGFERHARALKTEVEGARSVTESA